MLGLRQTLVLVLLVVLVVFVDGTKRKREDDAKDIQTEAGKSTSHKIQKLLELGGLTAADIPPVSGTKTFAAATGKPQAVYTFDSHRRPKEVVATYQAAPGHTGRSLDNIYKELFIYPSGLARKTADGGCVFKNYYMSPGHILALDLGAHPALFNYVPQSSTSNQANQGEGCWRRMEIAMKEIMTKYNFHNTSSPNCKMVITFKLHYDSNGAQTKDLAGAKANAFFQSIFPEKMQMTAKAEGTKPACVALNGFLQGTATTTNHLLLKYNDIIALHRNNNCPNYNT